MGSDPKRSALEALVDRMPRRAPGESPNPSDPRPAGYVQEAFKRLIVDAEGSKHTREGLVETPARASKAWIERMKGYREKPEDLFKTFDSEGYDEMVCVRDIPFYSTCEHHLEDIMGMAHIAYLPDGKIVGLSKLARLVDIYACRIQTQERLTNQIAKQILHYLQPQGVAVKLVARHMCMERRGVCKPGCSTVTSMMLGAMRDNPETRAEAMELLR